MDWRKLITPVIVVAIIMALVGVIYNGIAADLSEKVDNKTMQMYILQKEKESERRDKLFEEQKKENALERREIELRQREIELNQREIKTKQKADDDKFLMQQKSIEQLIKVLREK